jgi:hypothetical protein
MPESFKEWVEVIAGLASTSAILAGAWWFLVTTQHKPRIQFDLGCRFFHVPGHSEWLLAEVQCIFENKGFVEHRIYDLTVSLHTIDPTDRLAPPSGIPELSFKRRLLPKTPLVPPQTGYYFVRPGVRQLITHTVTLPSNVEIVRVTAGFSYKQTRDPHTARTILPVQVEGPLTQASHVNVSADG